MDEPDKKLSADQPSHEDAAPAVEPPRLSIFHLLLWTACSAVLFGIKRAIRESRPSLEPETAFISLFLATVTLLSATVVTGSFIVFRFLFRKRRRSLQAGEWILLCRSGVILAAAIADGLGAVSDKWPTASIAGSVAMAIDLIVDWVCLGMFLWIARFGRIAPRWRVFMVLAPVFAIVLPDPYGAYVILPFFLSRLLLMCVLLFVIYRDLKQQERLHLSWLHWLGAVTLVCHYLLELFWYLLGPGMFG